MDEIYQSLIAFFDKSVNTFLTDKVPDGTAYPYATADISINDWDEVSITTLNIYDKGTDPTRVNNIAQSILDSIGTGIIFKSKSYGYYILKGSPMFQHIPNEDNICHGYMTFAITIVNR